MRTTIDIDKNLIEEALKLSKISTKKELINLSLKEFIRRRHLEKLKNRLGNCDLNIDLSSLKEMRKDESLSLYLATYLFILYFSPTGRLAD